MKNTPVVAALCKGDFEQTLALLQANPHLWVEEAHADIPKFSIGCDNLWNLIHALENDFGTPSWKAGWLAHEAAFVRLFLGTVPPEVITGAFWILIPHTRKDPSIVALMKKSLGEDTRAQKLAGKAIMSQILHCLDELVEDSCNPGDSVADCRLHMTHTRNTIDSLACISRTLGAPLPDDYGTRLFLAWRESLQSIMGDVEAGYNTHSQMRGKLKAATLYPLLIEELAPEGTSWFSTLPQDEQQQLLDEALLGPGLSQIEWLDDQGADWLGIDNQWRTAPERWADPWAKKRSRKESCMHWGGKNTGEHLARFFHPRLPPDVRARFLHALKEAGRRDNDDEQTMFEQLKKTWTVLEEQHALQILLPEAATPGSVSRL